MIPSQIMLSIPRNLTMIMIWPNLAGDLIHPKLVWEYVRNDPNAVWISGLLTGIEGNS